MQINNNKANITETDLEKIKSVLPQYYTRKRLSHTLSVEKECTELAKIYDFSEEDTLRLRAAALLHDITKKWSDEEQIAYCQKHDIPYTEEDTYMTKVIHSRTGAHLARCLFPELVDDGIYDAILFHTTAKPEMPLATALLYLADYIEPERTFVDCVKLRTEFYTLLEQKDKYKALYETLVRSFGYTVSSLVEEGSLIHVDIILARNYYLLKLNKE